MAVVGRGIPNRLPDFVAYKVVSKLPDGVILRHADGVGEPFYVKMEVDDSGVDFGIIRGETTRVYFYKCGFVPDPRYRTADFTITKEFAAQAVYTRRVYGMQCMHSKCTLPYEGAEHGLFRLSQTYMFCVSVFYRFQIELISSRSGLFVRVFLPPDLRVIVTRAFLQCNLRVLYAVDGVDIRRSWINAWVFCQPGYIC
jgi:hypothetical protein